MLNRMPMNRRQILTAGAALAAASAIPGMARAEGGFAPRAGDWRNFQAVTRLEIFGPSGLTQAWVPLPSFSAGDWFRPGTSTWTTNAKTAAIVRESKYGAQMLHAVWENGEGAPAVEITSAFATRDRYIDLSARGTPPALLEAERALYTAATDLIPVDGIVKQTADQITAGAHSDVEKAQRIYEWVVEATVRDPQTRGCGVGDIAAMLRNNTLSGKCADLNALFTGLARAAGLPAREIYGLRVAPSRFGYKSLGANSATVTKAQHCRAEIWLAGHGWVAADPADVRKVMLEEPPANLPLTDPKVAAARKALFGSWETNWLAYNSAHDVVLPGSNGPKLGFLMYPQAETGGERIDCLDPDGFKYSITAKEVSA
jgi:transglutaminase-like putative cysteine protease